MEAMMGEHGAALSALLYLPFGVLGAIAALQAAAGRGWAPARRLLTTLFSLPGRQQLALLLIALSATVHAALVPGHASEQPVTAVLFVLDAVALGAICLAGFTVRGWRVAAGLLLLANLGAYAVYLLAGWETPDPVGIGTKLAEALALVLIVLPARRPAAIRLLEVWKP